MLCLITELFNYKMMQFLLIAFHSVGKASNLNLLLFLPDSAIFLSLVYKANTLFLFSASAYYRVNCINNAAIIVYVCWCGCQSVVCMCVINQMCVCACNI